MSKVIPFPNSPTVQIKRPRINYTQQDEMFQQSMTGVECTPIASMMDLYHIHTEQLSSRGLTDKVVVKDPDITWEQQANNFMVKVGTNAVLVRVDCCQGGRLKYQVLSEDGDWHGLPDWPVIGTVKANDFVDEESETVE